MRNQTLNFSERENKYLQTTEFYEKQTADVSGVLLGGDQHNEEDLEFSREVLNRFKHHLPLK